MSFDENRPQKTKAWRFVMLSPSVPLRTGSAKHLDSAPPKAGKRLPNGHIEILRFAQNDGVSHLSFLRPLVHGRLSPRRVPIPGTGPARDEGPRHRARAHGPSETADPHHPAFPQARGHVPGSDHA